MTTTIPKTDLIAPDPAGRPDDDDCEVCGRDAADRERDQALGDDRECTFCGYGMGDDDALDDEFTT